MDAQAGLAFVVCLQQNQILMLYLVNEDSNRPMGHLLVSSNQIFWKQGSQILLESLVGRAESVTVIIVVTGELDR